MFVTDGMRRTVFRQVARKNGFGDLTPTEMNLLVQIQKRLKKSVYRSDIYLRMMFADYSGPRAMFGLRLQSTLDWLNALLQNQWQESDLTEDSETYKQVTSQWTQLKAGGWQLFPMPWKRVVAVNELRIPAVHMQFFAVPGIRYPESTEKRVAVEPALGVAMPWPLVVGSAVLRSAFQQHFLSEPKFNERKRSLYVGFLLNRSIVANQADIYRDLVRTHPEFRSKVWDLILQSTDIKADLTLLIYPQYVLLSRYLGEALIEIDEHLGSQWDNIPNIRPSAP